MAPNPPPPRICRISEDTRMLGHLVSADPVICHGVIEGSLRGGHHVHIGDRAIIAGDVTGTGVRVDGIVKGRISTSGHLVIGSAARVMGDVKVRSLEVEEGGRLDGRCTIDKTPATARPSPKLAQPTLVRARASRQLSTSEHATVASGTIG